MAFTAHNGDCMEILPRLAAGSISCCVTSPPYFGLRDYGHDGQIGLEPTPGEYVAKLVDVFREVRRVLRDDGTLWLNLGDCYASSGGVRQPHRDSSGGIGNKGTRGEQGYHAAGGGFVRPDTARDGLKPKDLLGIPWRVAFALQADGWYLRQDIIWSKPNPMPESVRDRCTKAHEYIFLLSKSERYHFDADAISEPSTGGTSKGNGKRLAERAIARTGGAITGGTAKSTLGTSATETRNRRSVWTVTTKPFKGAHFATFPPDLIEPCILAGCHPAGKRCDCMQPIRTPTGTGACDDPTMHVGRAGMERERRPGEGVREITRREQRIHAERMRTSPHRAEMESICGPAFAHYIRTDRIGARPLPPAIMDDFIARGWIERDTSACACPDLPAGTVLDPFLGSGTTALVALRNGRNAIGCELNPDYVEMAKLRVAQLAARTPLFTEPTP